MDDMGDVQQISTNITSVIFGQWPIEYHIRQNGNLPQFYRESLVELGNYVMLCSSKKLR